MRNIAPAAPARRGRRAVDAVRVQPAAALPGRHRRRGAAPTAPRSRSAVPSRTTVSTSRSSSSTPRGSATCVQGDLGKDYQSNTPVIDKLEAALPVSLAADALRADPRAGRGDPARRAHRVPRQHQDRPAHQRRRVRAARAAELRARARARVLRRGEVATRHTLARADPGDAATSRAGSRRSSASPPATSASTSPRMLLPAISLAAGLIAVYMRLLRSDMIATLQENYITMARAKGLSDRRILWRHALRPSSLTLLTVAGLNFGTLIGGAVAVEVIFAHPRHRHAHLPGDQRPPVRRAPELHRDHRHRLRAHQLRHRLALRGARPEDPPCPRLSDPTRYATSSTTPSTGACRSTPAPSRSPRSRPGPRSGAAGRRASASPAWLSIAWIALVVGCALLAPVLPLDDPQGEHHRDRPARARSPTPAPRPATSSAATSTGATCCRACSGAGAPPSSSPRVVGAHRLRARRRCSASSAATSAGRVDIVVSLAARRVPRHPRGDPRARAGHHPAHRSPGTGGGGLDPEVALILALGIVSIPVLGRITRASTLSWSEREFVLAAQRPGRQAPAHHLPRGAAQRAAGDVLDRAARHRGGHRRRGHARASSARASSPTRPRGAT